MNTNTEFELFTQQIYQKLVNNDVLMPTIVQHNVKLKGKSGCEHQIDVYWEYKIDGIVHRVAIECKNYNTMVPIGKVRDFFGVLQDLNNVQGIMVTSQGYQKGAKQFADYYGISLKMLRHPYRNESFGTITTTFYTDKRTTLYLIDEGWIKEHNFDVDRIRGLYAEFQHKKADYWKTATHLPIETTERFIRDSKGNVISSIDSLGLIFVEKQAPGTALKIPFKDGWVESRLWGTVKIREIKIEYESTVQETNFNLAADDFVEAILEDALRGSKDYISKH